MSSPHNKRVFFGGPNPPGLSGDPCFPPVKKRNTGQWGGRFANASEDAPRLMTSGTSGNNSDSETKDSPIRARKTRQASLHTNQPGSSQEKPMETTSTSRKRTTRSSRGHESSSPQPAADYALTKDRNIYQDLAEAMIKMKQDEARERIEQERKPEAVKTARTQQIEEPQESYNYQRSRAIHQPDRPKTDSDADADSQVYGLTELRRQRKDRQAHYTGRFFPNIVEEGLKLLAEKPQPETGPVIYSDDKLEAVFRPQKHQSNHSDAEEMPPCTIQ